MRPLAPFRSLKNPLFAQLYAAQTISLLGDALTWVGLALLAFELVGSNAATVLGTALTLRVIAFVLLSPLAGVLADRINRKALMVGSDLARVVIIALVPFVTEVWHVYLLIFLLNAFTAFFTPTFQATIPLVAGKDEYPQAIALSGATYELLGVLGPGIAGGIAALLGVRDIFWVDSGTFLLSGLLILLLPASLSTRTHAQGVEAKVSTLGIQDLLVGTRRLFGDASLRYVLLLQLAASVAGAWYLVNTVVIVKGGLNLGDLSYGWVMASFGVGATLAALATGALEGRVKRTTLVLLGTALTSVVLIPANLASLMPLLVLWFLGGAGQNWVNLPTQTLIADRTPTDVQGRVYGAHFAWSHLWWAFSYPLAGWLGTLLPEASFLWGGLTALGLTLAVQLILTPHVPAGFSPADNDSV